VKTAALALVVLLLASCASRLGYLVKQGDHLLRYSSGTESIDDLLKSPTTQTDTREFLQEVKEIRTFAVDSNGLRDDGNHARHKSIDRDYLVDLVHACDAASFSSHLMISSPWPS